MVVGAISLASFFLTGCAAFESTPPRVLLEWTTASEVNTAGFNLYRSENKDGPFAKINAQIIPASTDAVLGGKYQYADAGVEAGQTYYYQLEDVEYSGITTRHGPIVATASGQWNGVWVGVLLAGGVLLGGVIFWRSVRRKPKPA